MLEHMVDTVLYFEGDKHHTFRILRAVKNRFGSTNEIGIFEMQTHGLVEVMNPSQVFLEERLEGATGSSIVVAMEGSRLFWWKSSVSYPNDVWQCQANDHRVGL